LFGPLAVFLSVVIFFDIAKSKKTTDYPKAILYKCLICLGLYQFCLYSFYKFKDPIAFIHAQDWWGRPTLLKRISNILMLIPHDIPSHPISTPLGVYEFDHFINLLIMIAYILIIVFAIDKLPLHYTLFAMLILLEYLWALGGIFINTSAFARLSYISVPIFIAISYLLEDEPWLIGVLAPSFFSWKLCIRGFVCEKLLVYIIVFLAFKKIKLTIDIWAIKIPIKKDTISKAIRLFKNKNTKENTAKEMIHPI